MAICRPFRGLRRPLCLYSITVSMHHSQSQSACSRPAGLLSLHIALIDPLTARFHAKNAEPKGRSCKSINVVLSFVSHSSYFLSFMMYRHFSRLISFAPYNRLCSSNFLPHRAFFFSIYIIGFVFVHNNKYKNNKVLIFLKSDKYIRKFT